MIGPGASHPTHASGKTRSISALRRPRTTARAAEGRENRSVMYGSLVRHRRTIQARPGSCGWPVQSTAARRADPAPSRETSPDAMAPNLQESRRLSRGRRVRRPGPTKTQDVPEYWNSRPSAVAARSRSPGAAAIDSASDRPGTGCARKPSTLTTATCRSPLPSLTRTATLAESCQLMSMHLAQRGIDFVDPADGDCSGRATLDASEK